MLQRIQFIGVLLIGVCLVTVAGVAVAEHVPSPTDVGTVPRSAATSTSGLSAALLPRAGSSVVVRSTPRLSSAESSMQNGRATDSPVPRRQPARSSKSAGVSGATARSRLGIAGPPVELVIPGLSVQAPVHPVDVVGGELQVPDDPQTVGWWRSSVAPGSAGGSVVIDGHIDSARAGIGALFHLANLDPGQEVSVRTRDGRVVRYTVQARRVYAKAAGLPADIFTQTGPPRLVLISCGGTFDPSAHSYEQNIVVYATPQS